MQNLYSKINNSSHSRSCACKSFLEQTSIMIVITNYISASVYQEPACPHGLPAYLYSAGALAHIGDIGIGPQQVLADMLTPFQSGRADFAHLIDLSSEVLIAAGTPEQTLNSWHIYTIDHCHLFLQILQFVARIES